MGGGNPNFPRIDVGGNANFRAIRVGGNRKNLPHSRVQFADHPQVIINERSLINRASIAFTPFRPVSCIQLDGIGQLKILSPWWIHITFGEEKNIKNYFFSIFDPPSIPSCKFGMLYQKKMLFSL